MDMREFTIQPEHLKLLKAMNVVWNDCEFGAPEIDPKRPYGNSGVHQDMIEILGLEEVKDGIYKFRLGEQEWLLKGEDKYNLYLDGADEEKLLDELDKLHKEMQRVFTICLRNGEFKAGTYEAEEYSSNWKLKEVAE